MAGSAHINSPEVILTFRNHYVKFDEECRQAVAGVRSDCHRVLQWLQHEQLQFWRTELRKCEQLVEETRSAYLLARFGAESYRKTSYVDEQKIFRKAEQRKADAENHIRAIKKWSPLLAAQAQKLMGPVDALSTTLDTGTPRTLARLDFLVRSLEEYLRAPPPGSGTP